MPVMVPAVIGIIGQMQGFRLVTTPAANRSGTATNGRCCSAPDSPDCSSARVTTREIITTLGAVSRTAVVAGATGLVGSHLLQLLLADSTWSHIVTIGRRPLCAHAKLEQRIVDFDQLDTQDNLPNAQDVFCCLGTTIKQAGSQEAFRRVDFDYVLAIARAGLRGGAGQFLLVSAIGADPNSRVFYSRVKGETEAAVRQLPYRAIQIFRPSLLLGERSEFRLGERIAMLAAPLIALALVGRLRRYRPIPAAMVAAAMISVAKEAPRGPNVFEYDGMEAATR